MEWRYCCRLIGCLVVWLALDVGVPHAASAGQAPDVTPAAAAALQAAMRTLERREYAAFIQTFVRPSEVQELLAKHGDMAKVAAAFAESDRPAKLLRVLQAALKVDPVFNDKDGTATYRFDPPLAGERRLRLQRIGDRWYLRD